MLEKLVKYVKNLSKRRGFSGFFTGILLTAIGVSALIDGTRMLFAGVDASLAFAKASGLLGGIWVNTSVFTPVFYMSNITSVVLGLVLMISGIIVAMKSGFES